MDNNAENGTNVPEKKEKGYAEEVKGTIISALLDGSSFLQRNRKGIDYSFNAVSGTVYSGVNQAYLQQVRLNKGYINPHFMTYQQCLDKTLFVKHGEKGFSINYWAFPARYQKDEYPINPETGLADKSKQPIFKKGMTKLKNGREYGENQYNTVFNLEQISPNFHRYRIPANAEIDENGKKKGVNEIVSAPFVLNKDVQLKNPYLLRDENDNIVKDANGNPEYKAKPGMHYKAKDDSIIERFAEDMSKYFNSCITGEEFKAVKYSQEDIKTLQAEIDNRQSHVFEKINSADFSATGQDKKNERIETNRAKKAEERSASIPF
jgi:hypothetical protein